MEKYISGEKITEVINSRLQENHEIKDVVKVDIKDIKPLDCIFFRGTELVSTSIVLMEQLTMGRGEWSHVGIVINKETMPSLNVKDDCLYVWESTMSSKYSIVTGDNTVDAESNEAVFGVQIRKLESVVTNSLKLGVKVGWGKLICNPIDRKENETDILFNQRIEMLHTILDDVHTANYHRPYTKNVFRLLAAMFTCGSSCCRKTCCPGENWRFCSQFVSIVYENIGVMDKSYDPETIVPQDLATPEFSEEGLPKIMNDVIHIMF
jgi:hypothetical protein